MVVENEVDTLDDLGLIGSKLSDVGWTWNEADSLCGHGLIDSKFSDDG